MRQTGRREGFLVTAKPDVIGNIAEATIAGIDGQDGAILVLEVIAATRLKTNSIKVEPGAPEATTEEVCVAVDKTASVIAKRVIDLVLNVEVDHPHDALRRQKR